MKTNNLFIYKYQDLDLEIKDFFSDYRLNKISLSNNPLVIKRMIETEYILFNVLKEYINVNKLDFNVTTNGRPILKDNKLSFNISHSNEYLVIALSPNNISTDIEYIDMKRLKIKKRLYENYQNKTIDDVIKDFTIKEAFIKYNNGSITESLKSIKITEKTVYNDLKILNYINFKYDNYYISVLKEKAFKLNVYLISDFNYLLNTINYNKIYKESEEEEE